MEKKFKVESRAWYGLKWRKDFYTFEEAKSHFREKIVCEEGVSRITDHIDDYVREHYPENTPAAFAQLKEFLTKMLTDPDYSLKPEEVITEDFEDDNIEFYTNGWGGLNCYVNNEDYDGKFPIAGLDAVNFDDEEREYYFYLTEKKDGMCWSWNLSLSPIGEDDEQETPMDFLDDDLDI